MDDNIHDWAYMAMSFIGMSEEEAYKWANEMLNFIKNLVFEYAKEIGVLDKVV